MLKIRDLSARTGAAERQIRYMIAEGFVPAPRGSRAQPEYGDDHLDAIRRYLALRRLGLPPAAIKVLGSEDGAVTVPIVEGIALAIEPHLVGRRLDPAPILDGVARALRNLQPENDDDGTGLGDR